MAKCPKCQRVVPDKRICIYCGTLLADTPATVLGMNADQWLKDGARVAQMKQWDRALSCFENALKIAPRNFDALFNVALVQANRGQREEAFRAISRALELKPNDEEALRLRTALEEDKRPQLPPGRPWKTLLEMVAGGGPEERWIVTAGDKVQRELKIIPGPEAILVMNWILALPAPAVDTVRRPLFNVGSIQQTGLLLHLISTERIGFIFRYADRGPRMPDSLVTPQEVESMAALIHGRVLIRIILAGAYPWGAFTTARLTAMNRRLASLSHKTGIEAVTIPDT